MPSEFSEGTFYLKVIYKANLFSFNGEQFQINCTAYSEGDIFVPRYFSGLGTNL